MSHARDKEDSKRFLTKANEQISIKLKVTSLSLSLYIYIKVRIPCRDKKNSKGFLTKVNKQIFINLKISLSLSLSLSLYIYIYKMLSLFQHWKTIPFWYGNHLESELENIFWSLVYAKKLLIFIVSFKTCKINLLAFLGVFDKDIYGSNFFIPTIELKNIY